MSEPSPFTDLPLDLAAVGTFSRGIARTEGIATLLGAQRIALRPGAHDARELAAIIGWGAKANTQVAVGYATQHKLPFLRLEDGFLRSVGLGVRGDRPLSIVVDDLGIYYDATRPSRLERLIETFAERSADARQELLTRASSAMARIREARLSKYNDSDPSLEPPVLDRAERVLVVDQTFGDRSVDLGLADEQRFAQMLQAALDEHPQAAIVVKTHPDVIAGKKRGYLGRVAADPRVSLVSSPINPLRLIEHMTHVYVATSQLGFEALLLGKRVSVFGAPFYAGWGLTDDRIELPRRGQKRTLAELFAAAYILYPRYLHPDTRERGQLEDVIEHLARQRELFERNRGQIFCHGFGFWKRRYVRAYLRSPGNRISFVRSASSAQRAGFDANSRLLVWGSRESAEMAELAQQHGVTIERMEDGFIRSVGLGSDFVAPASLVVDRQGIYYDPTRPSDLESLLQHSQFPPGELERAAALRAAIVTRQMTKYNFTEEQAITRPTTAGPIVLVPGQVEDDASIRRGCLDVRTNLELLRAVREAHPRAFVIFKPHPDVLSKNRCGHVAAEDAQRYADLIATSGTLPQYLAFADEVHTMTSLVGFEALLRKLTVCAYGQPFYAGWGLTRDRHAHPRRTRRLALDELVAGTLIRYPRYLGQLTRRFTTPEQVIRDLADQLQQSQALLRAPWVVRQLHKGKHLVAGLYGYD